MQLTRFSRPKKMSIDQTTQLNLVDMREKSVSEHHLLIRYKFITETKKIIAPNVSSYKIPYTLLEVQRGV